eukprot:SAG11_NODE_3721_length_2261_cov_2.231730_2_plen_141_part_00
MFGEPLAPEIPTVTSASESARRIGVGSGTVFTIIIATNVAYTGFSGQEWLFFKKKKKKKKKKGRSTARVLYLDLNSTVPYYVSTESRPVDEKKNGLGQNTVKKEGLTQYRNSYYLNLVLVLRAPIYRYWEPTAVASHTEY